MLVFVSQRSLDRVSGIQMPLADGLEHRGRDGAAAFRAALRIDQPLQVVIAFATSKSTVVLVPAGHPQLRMREASSMVS